MAQDTTPAIVVYQGDGTNRVFSIPFDAGSGVINVEFILRGATQTYEYSPLAFTVNDDNTALTWNGEPLQVGDFICISRSTTAHSLAMYEGDGVQTEFEIPFIRGFYGSIGVAFVYRGATQTYEYEPKTFYVDADNTLLTWTGATLNAGDYIAIGRSTITGQPYELPNNQKHIEGALDNMSRQIQELKDRAVLVIDPTYRIGAPGKQNPIDWLKSIVRSKDFSVRGLRYDGKFLQFSLDNPDMPERSKTWTSILNTVNITTVREWYDEKKNKYHFQYSTDNGASWKELPFTISSIFGLEGRLIKIENKQVVLEAGVEGNADAIQKTREDFASADQAIRDDMNAEDSRLQTQITAHANAITTNKNDIDELGDDVAEIQAKIPESASGSNPLVTKQQLLDEEMDIREDLNEIASELQTQITAQAAEIATKQDQLTAGDNIIISGNIISATGAGGGVGFDVIVVQELPESGEKGIIYLVPKDSAAPDVYDEYVWVTTTSTFELIGSTRVDLTGYVKNTDYANSSTGGVIKVDTSFGVKTSSSGYIEAYAENLTRYPTRGTNFIIGKGTLENIKDDYVKRGITENAIVLTDAEKTAAQNWLGVGSGLPDQTDNAGKFLTTDGTTASWSDKPLVNNGDESKHNLCVGKYSATSGKYNVCVGESTSSYGGDYNTVVGYRSQIRSAGTVIGAYVQMSNSAVKNTAIIASGNKNIFYGEGIESDSFYWVLNGTPYKLCSSDGTIPAERIGNLDFGTMD